MDFEIFAHEDYVGYTKYGYYTGKIEPAEIRKYKITSYNQSLNRRIDGRYQNVGHLQLVSHQLIGMFAVRFKYILFQHNPMHNSQNRIDSVNGKNNQVAGIFGNQNQFTQGKQNNKGNTYRTLISGKTFGILAEVKKYEYSQRNQHRTQVSRVDKVYDLRVYILEHQDN